MASEELKRLARLFAENPDDLSLGNALHVCLVRHGYVGNSSTYIESREATLSRLGERAKVIIFSENEELCYNSDSYILKKMNKNGLMEIPFGDGVPCSFSTLYLNNLSIRSLDFLFHLPTEKIKILEMKFNKVEIPNLVPLKIFEGKNLTRVDLTGIKKLEKMKESLYEKGLDKMGFQIILA